MVEQTMRCFISFLLSFVSLLGFADDGILRFHHVKWDFGTIDESSGPVSHVFEFVNESGETIVIEKVISTCACAVPSYSSEPVPSGGCGSVTVTFDPTGLLDTFSKRITVVYGDGKYLQPLTVFGRIKQNITDEERFPYKLSENLFSDKRFLYFGNMAQGESKTIEISLHNSSSRSQRLSWYIVDASGCLTVSAPGAIGAGSEALVSITASIGDGSFGTFSDKIFFVIGSAESAPISVLGVAIEDLSSADVSNGPSLKCSSSYFNLRNTSGEKARKSVVISNEGGEMLILRKIECPPVVKLDSGIKEYSIAPGTTVQLDFELDLPALREMPDAKVKIICNDPKQPVFTIIFEGRD